MNYFIGSIVKGKISKIAFGGKGILRTDDNFVIFVPYTAPDDVVTCRITVLKKGYAEAELITVDSLSVLRTVPKCPYFGRCGGCQLQHLSYEAQIAYKEQAIKENLTKFAKACDFPFTMHPTSQQWHYRRHVYLTLKASNNGFLLGYIADDGHTFLPISQCPIFLEMQDVFIYDLQSVLSTMSTSLHISGKVMIAKSDRGFYLHFHLNEWVESHYKILSKAFSKRPNWIGVQISTPLKTALLGEKIIQTHLHNLKISYTTSSFIQNHPEESSKIYQELMAIAKKIQPENILDLYCGVGISSLLFASTAKKVLGVEDNATAIKMANANALKNGISNAYFKLGKVEKELPKIFKNRWDFILVNPPRTGMAKEAVPTLFEHKPKNILYVSCMPSTLARDLQPFLTKGYQIKDCQAFDMFPQTSHVETLIHMQSA